MAQAPNDPEGPELPRLAAVLLRSLLPYAERDEVLTDVRQEYRERSRSGGRPAASRWLWRQVLASAPALVRRGWWRGWSGFESRSERMQPGGAMFEQWAMDLRYALRRLRKRPAYAGLAVLTLALGVAGTAAVYGVAKQLLFEPLPVRGEDQVVMFWFEGAWSEAEFEHLRPDMTAFEAVAAIRHADATLQLGDAPARLVRGYAASAELFQVLGVSPAIGSGFRPGDDRVGAEPVAVLSHGLWRELGGSPSIVGERIEFSGVSRTIVGVMPPGFWFPEPGVRVWFSKEMDPDNRSGNYGLVGRMPPGTSVEAMGPQLERIAASLADRFGPFPEAWDLTANPQLTPLREHVLGPVRPALLALLGAMAVILLIACVNVAALMLGQVDSRGGELAVRSALGAGRMKLLSQLLVESLVIGVLASLVGAGFAWVGFRFLLGALPLGALAEAASVDWTLLWAAVGFAMLASTLVALVPGVSVARSDPQTRLSRIRTGGVAGRGGRLERALVVAQVALVLLLASGAALLIRSVANLRSIDPGVDVEGVAVIDVILPTTVQPALMPQVLGQLVTAVEALPGVASAAAAQRIPLRGSSNNWGISVEGKPELESTTTAFRPVSPGYFQTMGISVLSGRGLLETDRDPEAGEGAVVINKALADRYFPGEDPLGRRIAFMNRWDRIVGVVENVAEADLSPEPVPTRYMSIEQVPWLLPWHSIVIRGRGGRDAAALLDPARRAIQGAAPSVAVRELTTMKGIFDRSIGPALQVMSLLALLAGLALTLGGIGVYGVVSHFVARRKRDWGIRIALGLRPARVTRQIVGSGGALVVMGIAAGLVAFFALAHVLSSFLYGVETTDPLGLAGATAVLLGAGLLAAYVPARRASRIDPVVVLREQ